MPIRTPAHKQTDPAKAPGVITLKDYIEEVTFDEWVDAPVVAPFGDGRYWTRRMMWTASEVEAAREAWHAKKVALGG